MAAATLEAESSSEKVYVIRVEGLIDNGLNMYIDRGVSAAENDEEAIGGHSPYGYLRRTG